MLRKQGLQECNALDLCQSWVTHQSLPLLHSLDSLIPREQGYKLEWSGNQTKQMVHAKLMAKVVYPKANWDLSALSRMDRFYGQWHFVYISTSFNVHTSIYMNKQWTTSLLKNIALDVM